MVPDIDTVVAGALDGHGDEGEDGGKEGEDEKVVEDEEGIEFLDDVAFAGALGRIAGFDREAAEYDGEKVVKERGKCGGCYTLNNRPKRAVLDQLSLECRPQFRQVAQIGEEDGD